MLKGQVFSKQLFENQIFALFIDTFLNGNNGISDNYLNGMAVSYSGNNVTVASGAVCIQGRFLEEDTSSTISAGTETAYCKLVIEIDLDQQNTESTFNQGSYKIIKGANSYPALTQQDIVKNNAGVYQYELARFQNSSSGITNFQDKRTFLDFASIYDQIWAHIQDIDDGSLWVLKAGGSMTGALSNPAGFNGPLTGNVTGNATSADKLKTPRQINGTNFDGSGNIETNKWGKSRNIALQGAVSGNVNTDGSGDVVINTVQPVQTSTITSSKSGITFTLVFKRIGNLVTVNVKADIPSSVDTAVSYIQLASVMPSWAKTSDNSVVVLDNQMTAGGYSYVNEGLAFSDVMRMSISRSSSSDYRLIYAYAQSTSTSFPSGHSLNVNFKYIVS